MALCRNPRCREVVDRPLSASQSEIGPGRNPPIALWTSTWRPQLAPTRGQPRGMPTTRRRGRSVVASAAVVSRTSTRTAACTGSGCPPAYRASFRHLEAEHHRSRGTRRYGSAPSRCQGWRHRGGCRRPRRSAPERCPSRPGSARRLRRGLGTRKRPAPWMWRPPHRRGPHSRVRARGQPRLRVAVDQLPAHVGRGRQPVHLDHVVLPLDADFGQ
jgi:hypothetical protein